MYELKYNSVFIVHGNKIILTDQEESNQIIKPWTIFFKFSNRKSFILETFQRVTKFKILKRDTGNFKNPKQDKFRSYSTYI